MITKAELKELGFSSDTMEDGSDVFRKTADGDISALAWFDEAQDGRDMMSFAFCGPDEDVLWSGRTDDETIARDRVSVLSQAVDQYIFKEGSDEKKRDDALVLKRQPTHYIQMTTRSGEDDRPLRFISRSKLLREMSPESSGRLGTSEDVLTAVKVINTDLQCAEAANAPGLR